MAIPDTNTFSLNNVKNELQNFVVTSLSTAFNTAPNVSYWSAYKGSKDRLSNFRKYSLITYWENIGMQLYAIAFDGTNFWACDYQFANAIKITSGGTPTYYSGLGQNPRCIAFDGVNMWTGNKSTVTKITPSGIMTSYVISTNPMMPAVASGIAFDGANMWTANQGNSTINKITAAGVITTYTLGFPSYGIAYNYVTGDMWVTNNVSRVTKISPAGAFTTYTGTMTSPNAIAFDGTNMWTTNWDSVTKIQPDGTMTNYSTGAGRPNGLTYDGTNMWYADNAGDYKYVAKVTPTGIITTFNSSIYLNSKAIAFGNGKMWTVGLNGNGGTVGNIGVI